MSTEPLDRHALGRKLTWLANASSTELASLPPRQTNAHAARRIGVTGAPGAGKSTLLGLLAIHRAARGRLGIIAIDPSSPKTGGAILGDRVRMDELPGVSDIYIRSLGSRNTSDGLADNLPEMLDIMDEFGFAEVLLETVGVGQAEYAARAQVDTLVLVLLPDSGDMVQAMKAGIAEMADIFVVNKADLPGAKKMANDVSRVASIHRYEPGDWVPPVLLACSTQPELIGALSTSIDRHQSWLCATPRRKLQQMQRARYRVQRLFEKRVSQILARQEATFFESPLQNQIERTLAMLGGNVPT